MSSAAEGVPRVLGAGISLGRRSFRLKPIATACGLDHPVPDLFRRLHAFVQPLQNFALSGFSVPQFGQGISESLLLEMQAITR
jgi:hypothetical protein